MNSFAQLARPGIAALGVYEPGRPIEEVARELGFTDVAAIAKLASNENALGPSPLALKAMQAAAPHMHRYPDGGCFYLKQALAEALDVGVAQILPGNGSNELIELLGRVFLGPDTSIVMGSHAFVVYRLIAAAQGAEVLDVPMPALTHDLPAMVAAIRPDTRIVFVANPNNPTGTVVTPAAIEAFMDAVPESTIVCFDEAYVELLPPEQQPDCLRYVREGRNVVVLRTFSKTYGLAGLRIGYAVAPEACISLLNRVRQPFNANAMAQAAAVAALDDTPHVARTRALVQDGLAACVAIADELGLEYIPSVVNFLLMRVGKGRAVFESLMREGVIVRPMDGYGLPEYIRVTVGTPAENAKFGAALKRVMAARAEAE